MVGCGGSGQKAVRYVRDAVKRRLSHAGWDEGIPRAWQFIGIDTVTDQEDASIPKLPANDYVSVSLAFKTYKALNDAIETRFGPTSNPKAFKALSGWRPNPSQVHVPLQDGAGQLRAVGRAAGVLALQNNVQQRLRYAFDECAAGGPQLMSVSQQLGVNVPGGTTTSPAPLTLVVGSMAGGTGAGIMLDVIDLIRRTHEDGAFPVLVAFTPDIFEKVNPMMIANSAAFMSELMSAYWDDESTDSELIPAQVDVHTRGPHSVFVVGRRNVDGLDLQDSKNVYRAVGEALAAVTTSAQVQTSFHNFITVNWAAYAPANAGGYGFESSSMKGVASSFGSATLSIGRDRFREYLQKLLHRSIAEHLVNGFEAVAFSVLGSAAAKTMTGEAKVVELARRNVDSFLNSVNLYERPGNTLQISDEFVASETMKSELASVSAAIKVPLQMGQSQSASVWLQTIKAQASQARLVAAKNADDYATAKLQDWGSETFRRLLHVSTEFCAELSLPVVIRIIELSRAQILESADLMKQEAAKARESATQLEVKASQHLSSNPKGNFSSSASPVQDTITDFSKSVVLEWSARVRDRVAVALESVATSLLTSVEGSLRQALGNFNQIVTQQDGQPAVVAAWPRNDKVVPSGFVPSPVEFFLEDHSAWPDKADELLNLSLGDRKGLPLAPVEAARTLIIRGNFDGLENRLVPPLVWVDSHDGEPKWEVGKSAQVRVSDGLDSVAERIEAWITRPSTELSRFLSEGLAAYLSTNDPASGAPVTDHVQRLNTYKQKLKEALQQSMPLVEINTAMNATVHPYNNDFDLNVQGFPFGEGHPARDITSQTVQQFQKSSTPLNNIFTSADTESVLVSNFLTHPVHPSVLTSFTQPLITALTKFQNDPGLLRSSFWQWRRARVLENFIPLPDKLRVAAIRGFAVARSLGLMTAYPDKQNEISTEDGVLKFPLLLTQTNASNVLPAILEAMIVTFGEASTRGKAAFDAYGALIKFGTGGGLVGDYEVGGILEHFLREGNCGIGNGPVGQIRTLDEARVRSVSGADMTERCDKVMHYLTENLNRLHKLEAAPIDPKSWRTQEGTVEPPDTLTLEILGDMKKAYFEVLQAVERFKNIDGIIP